MKSVRISGELAVLLAILSAALGLRLWGAFFGLPYVYHPDEGFEVHRAVRLGMAGFDFERVAKGGYYFLLCLEYGVYFLLQRATGAIENVGEFAMAFVRDPSPFWKIGRVTTAILGTLTVALVWYQGKRAQGTRCALLAAWFLAASFQHVVDSHTITVDVPMTLFAFVSVVMITEDVAGRRRLPKILFALAAAYAIMNKLPAALLFLPYFLGAWMRGGLRGPRGVLSRETLLPVALTALVYVLANPGFILGIGDMMNLVSHNFGGASDRLEEYRHVSQTANLWEYYGRALLKSEGPALLALCLAGGILALIQRRKEILLHLSFAVLFFMLIAGSTTSHLYYPRYILPVLPALCLSAGFALDLLLERLHVSRAASVRLAALLGLLFTAEPILASIRWDSRLTRRDTRTLAVEWIERNVPNGQRVLLEGFPEETAQLSIPLQNVPKNIQPMIDRLNSTDPGKAKFWELKLAAAQGPAYDLVTIRPFENWCTFDQALSQGIQWVVLRREFFAPDATPTRFARSTWETRTSFYQDLFRSAQVHRRAAFDADPSGAPGYDLEIWQMNGDPTTTLAAPAAGP